MQTKQEIEALLHQADGEGPIPRQNSYLKAIAWLLFILAFRKSN